MEWPERGACPPGNLPLLLPLPWSSTPQKPLSAMNALVFLFPTLVCHLVPSSPKDLGLHVQGFWPADFYKQGLLQDGATPRLLQHHPVHPPISRTLHQALIRLGLLGNELPPGPESLREEAGVTWSCTSMFTQRASAPALRVVLGPHGCSVKIHVSDTSASQPPSRPRAVKHLTSS